MFFRGRAEHGSLPLTLLAVIILAGVVVALFSVVRTGTQSSGRDRDFASAIQIADAGVQEAYLALRAVDPDAVDADPVPGLDCTPPAGALPPTVGQGICLVDVQDGEYVWRYERLGSGRSWEIESWGAYRDSIRLVTANVSEDPIFSTAILSVDTIHYAGGGTTNPGGNCTIEPFTIGAGGAITLTGQTAACIRAITVFNQSDQDSPGSNYGTFEPIACDADSPDDCNIVYNLDTDLAESLGNPGAEAFSAGGICTTGGTDVATVTSLPDVMVRGTTYCVDGNASLSSARTVGGTGDDEVIVYVSGNLNFNANSETNFGGEAGDLLFNVGGTNVTIQSTAKAAAAIMAPNAFCHSQGGAGPIGQFAGAMVCGSVQISGNWTYDSSTEDLGGSIFTIRNWAERPSGSGPPTF